MHTQSEMSKRCLLGFGLFFILLLPVGLTAAERETERPPEKVIFAYSSLSANMAPLWITHERGFFRKYGVEAQLVFIESGSTTVQSLTSKDVSFAQMAGAGVIQSRLRGSDVVMIAGVINTLTFKLYVDKTIKHPDQLKGKTVAVTRYGSSTDFALRSPWRDMALPRKKMSQFCRPVTCPPWWPAWKVERSKAQCCPHHLL